MILVDTSVWVSHLRDGNEPLKKLLYQASVATHPFIVGELSCGSIKNRRSVIELLKNLPVVKLAEHDEVLELIEARRLFSSGIGWVDAHLLCSALISKIPFWTFDTKLRQLSVGLKINYSPTIE